MNCPSCQSNSTKKLSMVYATGTRTYTSRSRGGNISSRGTISSRSSNRVSTSQTALASAIQLPKQSSLTKIVTVILVIAFVIPTFAMIFAPSPDVSIWKRILAFILFCLTSTATYFIYKFLNKGYEKHKKDFNNAWICMRCGHAYDPNNP